MRSRNCPSRSALARADDIGQACKIDAAAGLHSLDARRRGEMTLARSGRARKWITSLWSTKSSWARARMRLRSSDGWKEKSNPCERLDGR